MKLLIAQPKQEQGLVQFKREIALHPSVDVIVYPEGYCKESDLADICSLAKTYETIVVLGYRDANHKDRALIVNRDGRVTLDRAKTPEHERLYAPSVVTVEGMTWGYVLCREIYLAEAGLETSIPLDLVFNPIGVGMFSEAQYVEWTDLARAFSASRGTIFLGTSHADGSYRNCGFSIPLAYCFDANGEPILLSENDARTRIIDLATGTVQVLEPLEVMEG